MFVSSSRFVVGFYPTESAIMIRIEVLDMLFHDIEVRSKCVIDLGFGEHSRG